MTIEYLKELTDKYIFSRNELAPITLETIRHSLSIFNGWIVQRQLQFTSETLQKFMDHYKNTHSSAYAERLGKHALYFGQWMFQTGILQADPSLAVKRPKLYRKKRQGYTPAEYRKLMDTPVPSDEWYCKSFIIIAFHTGLSSIDVCYLKWKDIDLDRMIIEKVRNKMSTRNAATAYPPIYEGTDLHIELLRLREKFYRNNPDNWVNPHLYAKYTGTGGGRRRSRLIHMMLRHCQRAGVPWRGTHGFRRGFCTAMANTPGVNLVLAAGASGHTTVQQLNEYAMVDPEAVREELAAPLLKHFGRTKTRQEFDVIDGVELNDGDEATTGISGEAGPVTPLSVLATGTSQQAANSDVGGVEEIGDIYLEPEEDSEAEDLGGRQGSGS